MRRLRAGLRAVIGLDRVVVVDVARGVVRVLAADDGPLLESLSVDDGASASACASAALADLLEVRADPVDPEIYAALASLDHTVAGDGPEVATLRLLERAHARRGCISRVLGQRPALPETGLRRALVPGATADAVLVLGDDDFTGLALAALGTRRVTVHDVDRGLLDVHAAALRDAGLKAELVEHDLREPMPGPARGAFGAVHVALPDGVEGLRLVLSRAATCLAPGGVVVASVSAPAPAALEPVLRELGLRVDLRAPAFHRYCTPDCRLDPVRRDLLSLRPDRALTPPVDHAAGFLPDRLYASEPMDGAPALSYTLEEIEDARYTGAAFFAMLLDRVPGLPKTLVTEVGTATGFASLLADEGFVLVHADRARRTLQACVSPLGAAPQQRLLAMLHAAHKPDAAGVDVVPDARCFVARAR